MQQGKPTDVPTEGQQGKPSNTDGPVTDAQEGKHNSTDGSTEAKTEAKRPSTQQKDTNGVENMNSIESKEQPNAGSIII